MTQTAEEPVISGRRARDQSTAQPTGEAPHETHDETSAPAKPSSNPLVQGWQAIHQWWQANRSDVAARKARADGKWWLMRWMYEQPTSVCDYVDYYLHQRDRRPDGRMGWGLRTVAPFVNGTHALGYRVYGLSVGLTLTLIAYALGWLAQRPFRFIGLTTAVVLATNNLSTWLAGS